MSLKIPTNVCQVQKTVSTEGALYHAFFEVEAFTSKKNQKGIFKNKRTGQTFIGSRNSKEISRLNEAVLIHGVWNRHTIVRQVRAIFRFHYPNNKDGSRTERIMDLSNLIQGPEDALTNAGVIKDDKLIESYDGSCRVYGSPKKAIEIVILPFEGASLK